MGLWRPQRREIESEKSSKEEQCLHVPLCTCVNVFMYLPMCAGWRWKSETISRGNSRVQTLKVPSCGQLWEVVHFSWSTEHTASTWGNITRVLEYGGPNHQSHIKIFKETVSCLQ